MPAYYRASLTDFLVDDLKRVLGELVASSATEGFFQLKHRQTKAWQQELRCLADVAASLVEEDPARGAWGLLLEYPIPRRQKRIDAVLLARDVVFCLEFKSDKGAVAGDARRQVEDYALDLRDFHVESRGRVIIPIVVMTSTAANISGAPEVNKTNDAVRPVVSTTCLDLAACITFICAAEHDANDSAISAESWDHSAYQPVPTIIEAAEALYAGHDVREIAHSHAGPINLTLTSERLVALIEEAQRERRKLACFVTGVPGAGKTLAGLNIVHSPKLRQDGRPAPVFLSGNYPLVKIVSAAIVRDTRRRKKEMRADRLTGTLVQNVNEFFREALSKPERPAVEKVVVFDEAQRAWDAEQNDKKSGHSVSQPESMLAIMDRHADWAVIVALVGSGQEIHNGEAGLAEWGRALRGKFSHWHVAASSEALTGNPKISIQALFDGVEAGTIPVTSEPALHLNVCLRSYRAEKVAAWVEAMLRRDVNGAAMIVREIDDFPIALTRSVETARAWLRTRTRGLRRCGLVASSSATRLRAHGIELSSGFRQGNREMYVHWYLAAPSDVRSSNQLEVAASEFECQGLELDWVGVCWGGDLSFDHLSSAWRFQSFSGSKWSAVPTARDRQYVLNTYRVLLTRAREGMVIWVPPGDERDPTRPKGPPEETAAHLRRCGLVEI